MPPLDRYHRDPAHGQLVPEGRTLANVLGAFLRRMGADARKQAAAGLRIDLMHWTDTLIRAAAPVVEQYWREGYRQRVRAILADVIWHKNLAPRWSGSLPDIASRVRIAVTNAVVSMVGTLTKLAREAVKVGGDALAGLFRDNTRAARIGGDEAHRAGMDGAMVASEHSGVVDEVAWLTSYGACKFCTSLEGLVVKLGEPFATIPRATPPYNVVYGPPAHNNCKCFTRSLINPDATPDLGRLRRMAMR